MLAAARSPRVRAIVESGPFEPLVSRFVAAPPLPTPSPSREC